MKITCTRLWAMATLLFSDMGIATATMDKRHVQLVTPTPFEWAEYGPTNPLRTDGSDFPCKIPQGDEFTINGTATEIAIGDEQTVSLSGWSVHGGGSCQFACEYDDMTGTIDCEEDAPNRGGKKKLKKKKKAKGERGISRTVAMLRADTQRSLVTEGHAPNPDSAWKVIHSIEGGCPKADVAGNLEPGQNPDTYTFTIPDDFAPGDYTWAWTWVNKIAASPEFYMNCAPIKVTAAAGSTQRTKDRRDRASRRRAATTSYPDLFLANIGGVSNGCTTFEAVEQQIAIAYPYPGSSVSYPNGQENLFAQACDGNPRNSGASAAATGGGGRSQQSSSTAAGSAMTATTSTLSLPSTAALTSSAAPLSAISATATSSEAVSSQSVLPVTLTPSAITNSVGASVTVSAATPTGSSVLDSACTDGLLLCVGGTQFSTCTGGAWDAPQDLAAHTTCEEGEGVGLSIVNHF